MSEMTLLNTDIKTEEGVNLIIRIKIFLKAQMVICKLEISVRKTVLATQDNIIVP